MNRYPSDWFKLGGRLVSSAHFECRNRSGRDFESRRVSKPFLCDFVPGRACKTKNEGPTVLTTAIFLGAGKPPSANAIRRRMSKPVRVRGYNDSQFEASDARSRRSNNNNSRGGDPGGGEQSAFGFSENAAATTADGWPEVEPTRYDAAEAGSDGAQEQYAPPPLLSSGSGGGGGGGGGRRVRPTTVEASTLTDIDDGDI